MEFFNTLFTILNEGWPRKSSIVEIGMEVDISVCKKALTNSCEEVFVWKFPYNLYGLAHLCLEEPHSLLFDPWHKINDDEIQQTHDYNTQLMHW